MARYSGPGSALFESKRAYQHFIDGQFVPGSGSEKVMTRVSPANGRETAVWPSGTAADADIAIDAAVRAFNDGRWSNLTAAERSDVLQRVAQRLKNDDGRLAVIEALETGKALSQAMGEIPWAGDLWDYAAGQARALHGDSHSNVGPDKISLVLREPIGPVALITPWNYPMVVLAQKLPFALAAGCTVVVKPSELTSGTTLELAKILEECGLPPGVFNVVTGYGEPVGRRLAEHAEIRAISFTGSTATARSIVNGASSNMKRTILELGGKNPSVVFADANLEDAADGVIKGFIYNSGAECCSGSRVLVERRAYEAFKDVLARQLKHVKVGDPLDLDNIMGAIVSEQQLSKIERYVKEGSTVAKVLVGGKMRTDGDKLFIEPTIFFDVPRNSSIAREEIFGPVIALIPFDDAEDAVGIINDTEYGLAAAIWTSALDTAVSMARRTAAGIIWINTFLDIPSEVPFGGIKQSGYGRESGRFAIEEFTVLKTIVIQDSRTSSRYIESAAVGDPK